ncbi:VWA domain-containing protein [Acidobacteria bacterium AB60]|nr:VWA domain-containing protein [Acidobacteria bacterium AB60]
MELCGPTGSLSRRTSPSTREGLRMAPDPSSGGEGRGLVNLLSPPRPACSLRSSSFWAGAAIFALLLATRSEAALAQEGPTFHIDTKLVNLWVNVTDKNGAIVGGLTRDDFKVAEDGRSQEIAIFERQSEQPLSIVLAIDTSGSTYKDRALEQDAGKRFVRAILRPQDQMMLVEFATDVRMLVDFTNKPERLDHGLSSLRGGEATAVYDTVREASDELAKKANRKILVLVSDGGDTVKTTTYAEALEHAIRGEVMIYSVIDVPIESSAGRDLGGEHALITLSEQTGGKSFYADHGGLDKAFAQVSEDLRTQYLIGYYPHNQVPGIDFHRVSVTVPRAAAGAFNIRYRAGYFANPPAQRRRIPSE